MRTWLTALVLALCAWGCGNDNNGGGAGDEADASDASGGEDGATDTVDPGDGGEEDADTTDVAEDSEDAVPVEDTDPDVAPDGENDVDANDDADAPEPLEMTRFLAFPNSSNVLSWFVEWETPEPATTRLDVDCGEAYQHTFESEELRTRHEVFFMGLRELLTCTLTATSTSDGRAGSIEETIEVGELPPEIPDLRVITHEVDRTQPGWTVWTLASDTEIGPLMALLNDAEGFVRWYNFPHTLPRRGASSDARILEDGFLIGGQEPNTTSKLIGWTGELLWESESGLHHDTRPSPFNEGHFLSLDESRERCSTRETVIVEIDRATNEYTWTWHICDHYTPPVVENDWSHTNAVVPVPGERSVIISNRNQNNLMRVNIDTDELEWVFGDNGDFIIDEDDRFMRQHAPEIQEDGTILLFDNGERGIREYSRAIEYELSFDDAGDPLRADVVWQWYDEDLFSAFKSDADRLANGNTLVTYSWEEMTNDAVLIEVTPDGEVVWELRSEPGFRTYRAMREDPPPFGWVIEPSE